MSNSSFKIGRKKRISKKNIIKNLPSKILYKNQDGYSNIVINEVSDNAKILNIFSHLRFLLLIAIPAVILLLVINNYQYIIVQAKDIEDSSILEVSDINVDIDFTVSTNTTNNFITTSAPESNFKSLDKRVYVLDQYFKLRNSPLYGQANLFVEACDRFGAPKDCITTAAIARHETDLCKYYNSAEMHNCMGWGGGGIYRTRFDSYKDHIDVATDVLVNQYGIQYILDPALMEKVFCGPDPECAGWGFRVKQFMKEIDDYSESLGVGRLTDLR